MTASTTEVAPSRRAKFHPLSVVEVRPLTKDSVEVSFQVPAELADEYDYVPGQYVALRKELPGADGELHEVRRSYSICAVPSREEGGSARIRVAIKKDLGGQFSTWANTELAAGETIEVMNPTGAFTSRRHSILNDLNHPEEMAESLGGGSFVAVAAGSGITPVIAIARSLLAADPSTRFDLIYANKAAMDVMFLEELADLKDQYPSRFALHHVLSREQRIAPLLSGRIDAEKLSVLLRSVLPSGQVDEWFLCGPFELVQMCRDTLAELGVSPEHVRFELFTTGAPTRPAAQFGRDVVVDDADETYSINFTLDGLKGSVKSPTHANESILNAALRVRPDVPFACAGGVCGTCRAKVESGSVRMEENYALEPDEVERGYVLTCQAHPTSDEISVNYDV